MIRFARHMVAAAALAATSTSFAAVDFVAASYSVAENETSISIGVARTTAPADQPASVNWRLVSGTATEGLDFVGASGTLEWGTGENSVQAFEVSVKNDSLVEGDETLTLQLFGGTGDGALGSLRTAALRIIDDESSGGGVVEAEQGTAFVSESGGSIVINLIRRSAADGMVSVRVRTQDGSAKAGVDYDAVDRTVSWASGDSSPKAVTVGVLGNTRVDGDRSFTVALSTPTGGSSIGQANSTVVTIRDDDLASPGTIRFRDLTYSASESEAAMQVIVERVRGDAGPASVRLFTSTDVVDPATPIVDYNAVNTTVTWADNETGAKTVLIPLVDDSEVNGANPLRIGLNLADAVGALVEVGGEKATGLVVDDDAFGSSSIGFTSSTATVSERAGFVRVAVARTDGVSGPARVSYVTADASGRASEDYSYTTGALDWAHGEAGSKDIVVPILAGSAASGSRDFLISLAVVSGNATLKTGVATVTIIDSPLAGRAGFTAGVYKAVAKNGVATLALARTGGDEGQLTVTVTAQDGSAIESADYSFPAPVTVTWADGDTAIKNLVIPLKTRGFREATFFTVGISGDTEPENAVGEISTATVKVEYVDEGGGAVGLPLLGLLALAGWARRRRTTGRTA